MRHRAQNAGASTPLTTKALNPLPVTAPPLFLPPFPHCPSPSHSFPSAGPFPPIPVLLQSGPLETNYRVEL